jgi:hypothetical protein
MAFHDDYLLLDLTRANLIEPTKDGTLFTAAELNALITIRQWRPGSDPNPSVLKRFAGTFIQLGIDYFLNVPGALNTESRHGRAVHAFLSGLESFDFPAEPLGNLPGRLFMAAVETVGDHGELLTGDVKVQELLRVITEALTKESRPGSRASGRAGARIPCWRTRRRVGRAGVPEPAGEQRPVVWRTRRASSA